MSFIEAIKSVFSKYATFSGRARRSEYWWFWLFYLVINALLNGLSLAMNDGDGSMNVFGVLASVFALAVFLPNLAVSVRRLHDIGKSGWAVLIGLIPIIGWIFLLVWFLKDSMPESNQYGECPKAAVKTAVQ